jgi:hypothetical protein
MADYGSPGTTSSDMSCGCGGYYPWLAQPFNLNISSERVHWSGMDQNVRSNINSYTDDTCNYGPFIHNDPNQCIDKECCLPKDSTENQHYFRFNPYKSLYDVDFKFPSGAWLTDTVTLAARHSGAYDNPVSYAWHLVHNTDWASIVGGDGLVVPRRKYFNASDTFASGDLIETTTKYDCDYDETDGCNRWYVTEDFEGDGTTFENLITQGKMKPLPPLRSNYTDPKQLTDSYVLFVDWAQPISGTGGGFPPHGNNLLADKDDALGTGSPEFGFAKILGAAQLTEEYSEFGTLSVNMGVLGNVPKATYRTVNQLQTYVGLDGTLGRGWGEIDIMNDFDSHPDGKITMLSANEYQLHFTHSNWDNIYGNSTNIVEDGMITRTEAADSDQLGNSHVLTYSSTMGSRSLQIEQGKSDCYCGEGCAHKNVVYLVSTIENNQRHSSAEFEEWTWEKDMVTDNVQVDAVFGGFDRNFDTIEGGCNRLNTYGLMMQRTIPQPFSYAIRVPKRVLGMIHYAEVPSQFHRSNGGSAEDYDQVDGQPALRLDPTDLQCARYWGENPETESTYDFTYKDSIVVGFQGRRPKGTGLAGRGDASHMVWGEGYFYQSDIREAGDWEFVSNDNEDAFGILPKEEYSYANCASHGNAIPDILHTDTFQHTARLYGRPKPLIHGSMIIVYDSGPIRAKETAPRYSRKDYIDVAAMASTLCTKLETRYYPTMPDGFGWTSAGVQPGSVVAGVFQEARRGDKGFSCTDVTDRSCMQSPVAVGCDGRDLSEWYGCDNEDSCDGCTAGCSCPEGYVVTKVYDGRGCQVRCVTPLDADCGPIGSPNQGYLTPHRFCSNLEIVERWGLPLACTEDSSIFNWDCRRNYSYKTKFVSHGGKRYKPGYLDTRDPDVRCAAGFQTTAFVDGQNHTLWHEIECEDIDANKSRRPMGTYSSLGDISGVIEDYNYRVRLLIDNELVIDEDLFTYSITGHRPTDEPQHKEWNGENSYIENVVINSGEVVDGQRIYGDAKNFRPVRADHVYAQNTNTTHLKTIDVDFRGAGNVGSYVQEITTDFFCPAVHVCSMSEGYDRLDERVEPLVAAVWWDNVTGVHKNLDDFGFPQNEAMPYPREVGYNENPVANCVRWNLRWYHRGSEITGSRSPVSEWANIARYNINTDAAFMSNGMYKANALATPDWRPEMDWSSDRWLYIRNFPLTRASFEQTGALANGIRLSEHIATGTAPNFPNLWPNNPATIVNSPAYNQNDKYVIGDRVTYEGQAYIARTNSSYVDVDGVEWECGVQYQWGAVVSNDGQIYKFTQYDSRNETQRCADGFTVDVGGFEVWDLIDCGQDISAYSASSTYSIGAKVKYNNAYYQANQNITTPEAFTLSHWDVYNIDGNCPTIAGPFNTDQWKYVGTDGDFLWRDWMVLHAGHSGNAGKLWVPFGCREQNLTQTGNCDYKYNLTNTSCPMLSKGSQSTHFSVTPTNKEGRLWIKDCLATSSAFIPVMPPASDH